MRRQTYILLFIFQLITQNLIAQNPKLAKQYLEEGAFDKAIYEYKLLVDKFPFKDQYVYDLVKAYQAQSKYDEVEKLLKGHNPRKKPQYWVYLGYNYQMQKDTVQAKKYYKKAIEAVSKRGYYAYTVGEAFKNFYLLDEALKAYQQAKQTNNNFYLEIALIYAEKSNLNKMMDYFLKLAEINDIYQSRVKYYLTRYITQDSDNEANIALKNRLVEKIKQTHNSSWYRLLQWLYIQQKEYKKAFFQLKSLYRKGEADISEIYHLANTAQYEKQQKDAQDIYTFVIEQNNYPLYVELSKLALLKMNIKGLLSSEEKTEIKQKFELYLNENWSFNNKISLQILYADFLAFHNNKIKEALFLLEKLEKYSLPKKLEAKVRLKKADILLHNELFNQALILYTQVQLDFPNNPIGYQATYNIARASFFQGDIDWAHSQLKVIKSISSDLIANDAIDLDVLIINNKEENDSLQIGLKTFAHAKFEIFRKNTKKALQLLDTLKRNFKGQLIYDDVLWIQAKIYENQKQYAKALENYQAILDNKTEDLLVDDALFRMAIIYEEQGEEMQAEKLFKKIVIEYPASFWFVDARKHFRKLRGD